MMQYIICILVLAYIPFLFLLFKEIDLLKRRIQINEQEFISLIFDYADSHYYIVKNQDKLGKFDTYENAKKYYDEYIANNKNIKRSNEE